MLFPDLDEEAIFISRSDPAELLGSFSKHAFFLDGCTWPSVEHYFQAMKFLDVDDAYKEKIRTAEHPKLARKWGRSRFKKIRKDWHSVRRVVMTRAIYIKCRSHSECADALLATQQRKIFENSMYDYFWGCGRDRRGDNVFGEVLMDVRKKLREEQA